MRARFSVLVVNEAFAHKYFPGEEVIGKRIKPGATNGKEGMRMREIVGVVGNAKQEAVNAEPDPIYYFPYKQLPVQASQKNYGLAAGTSKQFFSRTREVANRAPDANGRKALEDLLVSQDKFTAELAKGDPEALGDLQVLFEKTRQAAGSINR